MNYESTFEDENEYQFDAYGISEDLEQKVGQLLSIDEIYEFMKNRSHVTYDEEDTDLRKDEKTGLFYTDTFFVGLGETLIKHILVEKCISNKQNVDWERVTKNYDYRLINMIKATYNAPLTWVYPAEAFGHDCLVYGLAAIPKHSDYRPYSNNMDDFWHELEEKAILWFADNLPTRNDIRGIVIEYLNLPNDIFLWDRICSATKSWNDYRYVFSPDAFRGNIEFIAQERGGKRAAELVRLLQNDWQEIKNFKWFNLTALNEDEISNFEMTLFQGMERNLHKWEAETIQQPKSQKNSSFPLLSDQCRKENKVEIVEAELRAACHGTAVAL